VALRGLILTFVAHREFTQQNNIHGLWSCGGTNIMGSGENDIT
jgi:hypothetical protein